MLGEGLDRDKLNALLHDGTLALQLQANCGTFGAEMDLMRWSQVEIVFRGQTTPDVAVNDLFFSRRTTEVVMRL
jgi:hypothetical protein